MPNTPGGFPYPLDTAAPDVPADIEALGLELDTRLGTMRIIRGTSTVVVTAATSGNLTGIALGAGFSAAPYIQATVEGSAAAWTTATDTVTTTTFTLRVRHVDNTSTTSNVVVRWLAIGPAS